MYNSNIPQQCLFDISESLNLFVLKKYNFFACLIVPENQQRAGFYSPFSSISCHISKALVSCKTGPTDFTLTEVYCMTGCYV